MTPDRMIVCASGINDHNEFVEAVRGYYEPLEPVKAPKREPAKYIGGELREICESFMTYISISFQGVAWKDPDMPALSVLKQLVGEGGVEGFPVEALEKECIQGLIHIFLPSTRGLSQLKLLTQILLTVGISDLILYA
eukprot:CAMPEP_0168317174 /NCGR_PEP_ID=MMETSP0210-20121227/23149_1 /TAXON_ID=40633 /ORGANISM="Condylostoma magnum, Strain COL2" /LENGTH=137 /DNA_ID=CAMNT_0008312411 /DNA_START=669 /DNA_END=1082 /DNA_ORIENTATION=-